MSRLKKCNFCKSYSLKEVCEKCKKETSSAHYKFEKLPNAPTRSAPFKK